MFSTGEWIRYGQNCIITGATGVGKSWLACALAQKACRDGYRALYTYSPKLFRTLLAANIDGSLTKMIRRLARRDLLVIDDWGMEVAKRSQYRDFLELIDERHGQKATLLTSQYPPENWHEVIGPPPWATPSSTGSSTEPIGSIWSVIPCGT